jgi:hypothetical protein
VKATIGGQMAKHHLSKKEEVKGGKDSHMHMKKEHEMKMKKAPKKKMAAKKK